SANRRSGAGPLTWWRPMRMSRRPTSGGALQLGLEALQRGQALLQRRVVCEEVQERFLRASGHDEEGVHPFSPAQILARDPFDRAADLYQRRGQGARAAGEHGGAAVGGELAVARERAQQEEGDRVDDQRDE